jgi:hypothetical protein
LPRTRRHGDDDIAGGEPGPVEPVGQERPAREVADERPAGERDDAAQSTRADLDRVRGRQIRKRGQEPVGRNEAPPREQSGYAVGQVVPIAREELVRALPVEHHLDSCLACELEDAVLGVDTRASERLALNLDQPVEIRLQILRRRLDGMRHDARLLRDELHPLLLAHRRVVGDVAERVQLERRPAE